MERLTKRGADGIFLNKYDLKVRNMDDFMSLQSILERLAAYEDTGLTPEEFIDLQSCLEDEGDVGGTVRDLLELMSYRRLEAEGRLIKLPCEIGDEVYIVHHPAKSQATIECIPFKIGLYDWLGKTVFLTREEAEKVLKGAENEQNIEQS